MAWATRVGTRTGSGSHSRARPLPIASTASRLAPPALPGVAVRPRSSLGSPLWLDPTRGEPPRAACWQRRLTTTGGSIRWIYPLDCPLDLSVGSGRGPRRLLQPAGRHFAHSISIGDGLDGDCPSFSSLPCSPPGGGQRPPPPGPLGPRLAQAGAGPRAIAESLIPVRPSLFGLTGVKGGATARGAGGGGRPPGPGGLAPSRPLWAGGDRRVALLVLERHGTLAGTCESQPF